MRPADTSKETYDLQTRLYRAMSIGERFALFQRVNQRGRELARSGIRLRHPEYSAEQLEHAFRRMMIGDDRLFLAAWPDSPLLEP